MHPDSDPSATRMIVQTPLGALDFTASTEGRRLAAPEATFQRVELLPEIPQHMSVQSLVAVLVTLRPGSELRAVNVACRWSTPQARPADAQSGEGLDALSWQAEDRIVLVGTEDFEALSARLPGCGLVEVPYPVTYHPQGLEIALPRVREAVSLHFAIAVNAWPEPAQHSAWFAVDVDHARILAAAGGAGGAARSDPPDPGPRCS
jgi:hypothetical protein